MGKTWPTVGKQTRQKLCFELWKFFWLYGSCSEVWKTSSFWGSKKECYYSSWKYWIAFSLIFLFCLIPIACRLVGAANNFEFCLYCAQAVGWVCIWLLAWSSWIRKKTKTNLNQQTTPLTKIPPQLLFSHFHEIIRQQEMQKSFLHIGNWAVELSVMGSFAGQNTNRFRMKVENWSGSIGGCWTWCSGCHLELVNPLSSWLLKVEQVFFGLERVVLLTSVCLGHPVEGLQS